MTPREFFALLRIRRQEDERADYRMAKICEVVAGAMGAKNKDTNKPFTAQDFMPGQGGERQPVDVRGKALAFAQSFGFDVKPGNGGGVTSRS